MQGLKKAVQNSPLNRRKRAGNYDLVGVEEKDPFVEGIHFNCYFVGSVQTVHKFDHPESRAAIKEVWEHTSGSKSLKRMTIRVKAENLRVKDVATKTVIEELPIYRISYCGTTADIPHLFFYIHRDQEEPKQLTAEIFRLESTEKVKALILTVQKAFSIAYKVWQTKKRQQQRVVGRQSPDLAKKTSTAGATGGGSPKPKADVLIKIQEADGRTRSGSGGSLPSTPPLLHPSIAKIKMTNEVTGSMHELNLGNDFDAEFTQLASARSQPDLLDTSIDDAKPNKFKLEEFKDQIDPGSVDDLLKL